MMVPNFKLLHFPVCTRCSTVGDVPKQRALRRRHLRRWSFSPDWMWRWCRIGGFVYQKASQRSSFSHMFTDGWSTILGLVSKCWASNTGKPGKSTIFYDLLVQGLILCLFSSVCAVGLLEIYSSQNSTTSGASQEADAKVKASGSGPATAGRRPSKKGAFGVGSVIFGIDGHWDGRKKFLLVKGMFS